MNLGLRLARVGGPTSGAFAARAAWLRRDGILLGIFDDDRLLGTGEASPLPNWNGDGLERAVEALQGLVARSRDAAFLREVVDAFAKGMVDALGKDMPGASHSDRSPSASRGELAPSVLQIEPALSASPSARFAIETALGDMLARSRGDALGTLWSTRRAVPRSTLIGHLDDPAHVAAAKRAVQRGARTLKLKARGEEPALEATRVRELVAELEAPVHVRLDLNGGLDLERARRALDAYAAANVEFVEEPTAGASLLQLGACATPWFADESLCDEPLRNELVDCAALGGVVLKPTLLGGLSACRRLAAAARRRGKAVVVTHAFEGPIALAACAELAMSLANVGDPAAGIDAHAALDAFPPCKLPQLEDDGVPLTVAPAAVVGHGVTFTEVDWETSSCP